MATYNETLMLAASGGTSVRLETNGPQADQLSMDTLDTACGSGEED
jgi:phosphotransferase system HPr-like phosphotransfer protein